MNTFSDSYLYERSLIIVRNILNDHKYISDNYEDSKFQIFSQCIEK